MEQFDKDYNTRRPHMVIPEYGRNIQKMIEHAMKLEDRDERNRMAKAIISVMGQLNPHLRDVTDFSHKLWDHLFIMSDFKLDVDSPYPIPDKESIMEKPKKMAYPLTENQFKHYGKSIRVLIEAAAEYPEGDEKTALIETILNLMKKTYLTFNQDSVEDKQIITDFNILAKGKVTIPENLSMISTNDVLAMGKKKKTNGGTPRNNKQNGRNKQKKRRY
ncbi:MAG: DUF4290 domain-containing protein [Flavobacteriales bacterium]|nr:DUF4290 domain-containing protein [Flavobacteriales bacterium]